MADLANHDFKNPNFTPIYAERAKRLALFRENKNLLIAALRHYECGETGIVDFIQDWLITYDPRVNPAFMPFILFPKQKEYIYWLKERLDNRKDGLAEKSRDVGFTWLNVAFSIWAWRFKEGSKISFGSRKEALVDKIGDPDSIFEKIRMAIRYMPPEILPFNFHTGNHMSFLKIQNPDNGNTITGEAGDNIGRGGRSTIYFKDESAFYERPQIIDAALSQNSDVKIDCSTPNGAGNPFYEKRFGGIIDVFTFHWHDDPRKDQDWYDEQVRKESPVTVAQEIDIDYHASAEGICIPANWVRAAVDLDKKGIVEDSGAIIAGLDVADNDGTGDDNALVFRKGVVLNKNICVWKEGNTTQTTRNAHLKCVLFKVEHLNYDNIGVGAGVKGELWSLAKKGGQSYSHTGVNFGNKKLTGFFSPGKLNKDMFANEKAMLWWQLRRRFERTYEHVTGEKKYENDELISIPNHPKLISQLSVQRYFTNDAGKIQMESKKIMKKNGIKSPNEADAVVYCYKNTTSTVSSMAKRKNLQRRAA